MNPGSVITVHSYKGGTGKTLVSTSLAAVLANQRKNVCLIDLDLRAPSMDATFAANGKYWINDFLSGTCEPTDVLKDFSKEKNTKGRFLVSLANPSMEAIRDIVTKERRWEMEALRRMLSLKKFLINNLAMDYVIIDASPGLGYGSINAVAAADLVLTVSSWDASDITGTQGMIIELYDLLEKRVGVIVNKIPEQLIMNEDLKRRLINQFKRAFKLPVIDLLPCYCDIMRQERATIMVLEKPDHPFSKNLVEITQKVEKNAEEIVFHKTKPLEVRRTAELLSRLLYKPKTYRKPSRRPHKKIVQKPEEPLIKRPDEMQTYIDKFEALQRIAESIYYYSKQILEQPFYFSASLKPHSQELIGKLSSCTPGPERWKEYEEICKEILVFLFVPPLREPLEQERTELGLHVRDLILPIPYEVGGFWRFIQNRYTALAVIVECKNYSQPIIGNDVLTFTKYLGEKKLGLFGIILSRSPPARSATEEIKRIWREQNKLILCLDDEHLKTMIKLKNEGKDPEIIIDKNQREFLQSLE